VPASCWSNAANSHGIVDRPNAQPGEFLCPLLRLGKKKPQTRRGSELEEKELSLNEKGRQWCRGFTLWAGLAWFAAAVRVVRTALLPLTLRSLLGRQG